MSNEEFYGMSKDELFDFIDNCTMEDNYNLLQIKTKEDADTFIKICKNFSGASILGFAYDSGNTSPRRLFKRNNDICLTLGAEVFLPDLRYGETYDYSIEMVFTDVQEFSFIPNSIDKSTEIDIETFTVEEDICIFSCFARGDKTKRIYIKSEKLFVENFIDQEEEEENIISESVKGRAGLMFEQKRYNECIYILENEYSNLKKDAFANEIMSMCYFSLNNLYEAIRYINYAIELNPDSWSFFYHKGLCLYRSSLSMDALKCFNTALSLTTEENNMRLVTKSIIDLVNAKTRLYTEFSIIDTETFKEYIYYFDSIINLEYCFPEFKEKFKQYKNDAVNHFYNKQKKDIENPYGLNQDYSILLDNLKAILNVSNISPKMKLDVQSYIDRCNSILEKQSNHKKINDELKCYISDLLSKEYSNEEIIEAAQNKFPSVYKHDIEKILATR